MAISGAARSVAHGSSDAVGPGGGPRGAGADDGAAAGGDAAVGPGVFDAVESPEPHPARTRAAAPTTAAHFTSGDRTVRTLGVANRRAVP